MSQLKEEDALPPYWWTHRSLFEEAASGPASPNAEGIMLACVDDVKAKAREWLRQAASPPAPPPPAAVSTSMESETKCAVSLSADLIVLRDRMLAAWMAAQQAERQDADRDERSNGAAKPASPAATEWTADKTALLHTVHLILFRALLEEWITCWNADAACAVNPPPVSWLEAFLDKFLCDVAFTHATSWGSNMAGMVCELLTDMCGMAWVEQDRLLPRLTAFAWGEFTRELQTIEEVEVTQLVSLSPQARCEAAPALVERVVRLLRMIAAPNVDIIPSGTVSTPHVSGYVVIVTTVKAQTLIESLGRWLPTVGECLQSMIPVSQPEQVRRKQSLGGTLGSGSPYKETYDTNEEAADAQVKTPAAKEWVRRLQHESQRLFAVFACYAETSPWTIPLADIVAKTFYSKNDPDIESMRQHEALRGLLIWQNKAALDTTIIPASAQALAKACNLKIGHVLSCALDRSTPPSRLSIRVLSILLAQRPLHTLRHFLSFVCPSSSVAAACDFEAVITEKGRGSEQRMRAFSEEVMEENGVALTFFPKHFDIFATVEKAMVNLCNELDGTTVASCTTTATKVEVGYTSKNTHTSTPISSPLEETVECFFAAALDEAFAGADLSEHTSACEWLMFLAFICADTPLITDTVLLHVRRAARRFFAPRRSMLSYLHHHIVQRERYGLVAFFLPPLRAIGVDYSTASDADQLSCALRYPLSAEVAYFEELPRGYYSRQPTRLASNAKNDALHFFHELLMQPVVAKRPTAKVETNTNSNSAKSNVSSEKQTDNVTTQATKDEDNNIARMLFVDIIARTGAMVIARGSATGVGSGGSTSSYNRRGLMKDIVAIDAMSSFFYGVLRLCSTVTYWDTNRRHEVQRAIVRRLREVYVMVKPHRHALAELPMSFLLRGGCSLDDPAAVPNTKEREETTSNSNNNKNTSADDALKCTTDSTVTQPSDGDKIKEDQKPTKPDSELEPHAWMDWFCNADFEDMDNRAGPCALALLRTCNRDYLRYIPTKALLARRAMIEQHAAKEKDNTARATAAMEAAVRQDVEALRRTAQSPTSALSKPGVPQTRTPTETPSASTTTTHAILPRPLPLPAVRRYVEAVVATIVRRARVSIVDGVLSGVALRRWLTAAAGLLEPHALLDAVRRAVLQASGGLTRGSTKLDCAALSAFLGVVADTAVLPYARSFHAAVGDPQSADGAAMRRALPAVERDALALLRLLLADAARAVRGFLEERTLPGDWRAQRTARPLRRVLRLVARHDTAIRVALAARGKEVGAAPSGTDAAHPIQQLAEMECPLPPGMEAPVAEVEHIFRPVKPPHVMHIAPSPMQPTHFPPPFSTQRGGQEGARRKRHRSEDGPRGQRRGRF